MEIARPFTLLLFLLIPFLYYGHRRSLVDLSLPQRIVSLILRALIIALLICSLAGLQYLTSCGKLAVIFLADISDSISEEGLKETQSYIDEAMDQPRRPPSWCNGFHGGDTGDSGFSIEIR